MDYQNFFNRDFFPTPVEIIDQMMQFSEVHGKIVLEPSAGSGNIVDWLRNMGAKQVCACEINDRLRSMISSRCDIIGTDFLKVTAEQVSHVQMIVMNPPFTADERHILHAYEIAPYGCEIVALCNTNTIENACYNTRHKLRELINEHGGSEDLGKAFDNAERKTDVRVSVVRLYKPASAGMEFDGFFMEEDEETNRTAGIIKYNFVRDCVARYCEAVKRFDAVYSLSNEINELTKGIGGETIKFGAFINKNRNTNGDTAITKNYFKKQLQKDAWRWLLEKFDLGKYVTSKLRADINRFVEQQSNIPFTMRNIYRMVEIIIATNGNRMEQTLVDAFELICSYSAENSKAGEKWKTNSEYMVNRKFIIPRIVDTWYSLYNSEAHLVYENRIEDIEKALCYLTGENWDRIEKVGHVWNEERQCNEIRHFKFGELYKIGFFEFRLYKKGTGHFKFRDENVWEKFNREVARIKGWALPKNTAKTHKAKQGDLTLF